MRSSPTPHPNGPPPSHPALRSAARAVRRRRSAVLLYHGLGDVARDEDRHSLYLSAPTFRRQLELLIEAGFELVTVAELAERAGGNPPPPGLIAISFDDGMVNNLTVALPILEQLGVRATVYVIAGALGEPSRWMPSRADAAILDEDGIRRLSAAGIEIGSHSLTHPDMSSLSYERCLREAGESKAVLESVTGEPVRTFAYPFGRFGRPAIDAVRDSGYMAALTSVHGGSWDPFGLERVWVPGWTTPAGLLMRVARVYEPLWRSFPGRLVRLAARGGRRLGGPQRSPTPG